jgi:hypothetical protein
MILANNFKVAKYEKVENGFNHLGYDEYKITYLKGLKIHQLRIVVNGVLSKNVINLTGPIHNSYRHEILSAISDYKNGRLPSKGNLVTKQLKIGFIDSFYSKLIRNNIKNHLISIKKEDGRDTLTKYELI